MTDSEYAHYWFSPPASQIAIGDHARNTSYDDAYSFYETKLKDFILSSITKLNDNRDGARVRDDVCQFEAFEHSIVDFTGNKLMYLHSELHIRYLSFNGLLGLDVLEKGSSFVVNETRTSSHFPYRFGQVVELASVCVQLPRSTARKLLNFVFVRWYEVDPSLSHKLRGQIGGTLAGSAFELACHNTNCPGHLMFTPRDKNPFGFLKPSDIIRKILVVPDVTWGLTRSQLGLSLARAQRTDYDYKFYRIECMADHDLYSRLHYTPAAYQLIRSLHTSVLRPSYVAAVIPSFIAGAGSTTGIQHSDAENAGDQSRTGFRESNYMSSTIVEIGDGSKVRQDDDQYFLAD